ncbi:hypothetical protein Tco_0667781 [Tanacetum coccineum]
MEQMTSICDMIPICYDDDEDDTIAVDYLIMEDEHLDTIPATKLDEVIKSSVEELVPIPSEFEGIPDSFNDDSTSSDDNSPYGEESICLAGELAHIISPPEYDCFYFKNEPDQGNFMMDVVEDIFDNPTREPRVHVPNVLAPIPSPQQDPEITLFYWSPIHDISITVGRMIFTHSCSVILHPPVIDTLLPFSSKNENKVVNTGILASEEKSPPSSSHRGFKASKLSHHKSPMLIHGDNTPNLGVRHPHFYPP